MGREGQDTSLRILGIESSCDETAAAVVEDGRRCFHRWSPPRWIRTASTEAWFRNWLRASTCGPSCRGRRRLWNAPAAATRAGGCGRHVGPGLVGSLLVGMTYAKALCFAHKLPLIGVNHVEGHIHAVVMEAGERDERSSIRRWRWW